MKKKEESSVRDLRDQPVPPVKGAVNDPADVILRPDGKLGQSNQVNLEDTIVYDGWL